MLLGKIILGVNFMADSKKPSKELSDSELDDVNGGLIFSGARNFSGFRQAINPDNGAGKIAGIMPDNGAGKIAGIMPDNGAGKFRK